MDRKRISLVLTVAAFALVTLTAASEAAAQTTADRVARAASSDMDAATYYGDVQGSSAIASPATRTRPSASAA